MSRGGGSTSTFLAKSDYLQVPLVKKFNCALTRSMWKQAITSLSSLKYFRVSIPWMQACLQTVNNLELFNFSRGPNFRTYRIEGALFGDGFQGQGSMLWSHFSAIFRQKKLAFFSKTNVMFQFLHNLALFWVKNAIFRQIFRRKYFWIHNIGPR
jgi:hypothetical protein